MRIVIWIVVAAAALYALHRMALWAEDRGWIYYLRRKASPGTAAGAFLQVQAMLEPDKRHVIRAGQREDEEEDAAGDPPESGDEESGPRA